MILNTGPIKNWFGFTRRERRSTFSLLVIIVVLLVIRYTVPDSTVAIENISSEVVVSDIASQSQRSDSSSRSTDMPLKKPYIKRAFVTTRERLSNSKVSYTIQQEVLKIDINLSDTAELIRLPGIGSILSARIVKYRNFLGGFAKVEQLKEVYGLSEETFEMIKSRVKADSAFIKRINLNTADYKELTKVRYLEKYEITSILKYRQLEGSISEISELVDNKLITNEKAMQILPYLSFE